MTALGHGRVLLRMFQVEIKDLSKFGSTAIAKGGGLRFEDTTSPVDPGEKGKVAEAMDVCFPREVRPAGFKVVMSHEPLFVGAYSSVCLA